MSGLNWIQFIAILIGIGAIGVVLQTLALIWLSKDEGEEDDSSDTYLP